MKKRKHKIKSFILKALIAIGVIMIVGTIGSVDIGTLTLNEMLKYWIVSIVIIVTSWLLLRRCENA